ncbi:MAG: NADP-dependent malic enzyme [Candidatus Nanohaloarchaea archaeon]|nr:NADP-dependent malic enzyme [Candidatus Nanohaloarchaea archaeon]
MGEDDDALDYHRRNPAKIRVEGAVDVETQDDLSKAYTPGVAAPSRAIADDPVTVYDYTAKGEMAAVLSNGSAVLGLGDIGATASIPVMEGKSLLIREFGDVSAFPLVVDEDDPEELIATAERLEPMFGFLMLEDIRSPDCFRIEDELSDRLGIPVFHDDQHGAAIAILAGLLNALDVVGKEMDSIEVAVVGAGAAGTAAADILLEAGAETIHLVDRQGILAPDMDGLNDRQQELAERVNSGGTRGDLADAVDGADVLLGLATGGIVSQEMVRSMADDPIVFAMANPDPEIPYHDAKEAGAAVVGTGRADYPNQINNSLAFPGIVKGALRCNALEINMAMKVAAAEAIADIVDDPAPDRVVPSSLEDGIADAVAAAVTEKGRETGACRI